MRFKSNVFFKYKEEMTRQELEEVKIYNIKPKEGTVEVVVLKEKYIPNREIENRTNNPNSSYISENKIPLSAQKSSNSFSITKEINSSQINQQDHSVNEPKADNNLNIKPFDIINLNKYKSGKGEKSALYKDLLKSKNKHTIQATIKNKLEEIQEKLKKYEEMAMNLGKDFTNSFNK